MADIIIIRNNDTPGHVPTAGQLVDGELALNTYDNKLFWLDNAGVVKSLSLLQLAVAGLLTGFSAAAGTVADTDTILQAINKIVGNIALRALLASPTFTGEVGIGTTGTNPAALSFPKGDVSDDTRGLIEFAPNDTTNNGPFAITAVRSGAVAGTARIDDSWKLGYNINNDGGPIKSGESTMSLSFESFWSEDAGVTALQELYLVHGNNAGTVFTRPVFTQSDKSTGVITQFRLATSGNENGVMIVKEYDDLSEGYLMLKHNQGQITINNNSTNWLISHRGTYDGAPNNRLAFQNNSYADALALYQDLTAIFGGNVTMPSMKITGGSPDVGKVWTGTDGAGNGEWAAAGGGPNLAMVMAVQAGFAGQ